MSFPSLKELRAQSEPELQRLISELRAKLADLRFQAAGGSLRSVREIRSLRQTLARALTLVRDVAFKIQK